MPYNNPHDSSIKKSLEIYKEARKYYEPGVQAKCYRAVWKKYIKPKYSISYQTLMSYIYLAESQLNAPQ